MDLSSPINLIIASIYYIIVGLISLFSLFGVYILIRYGRSILLAVTVSAIYALFFLKILAETYATLHILLS